MLSVIICTHNPRTDYLRRTLDGLKAQRLPHSQWELLIVDNASKEPLAGRVDVQWHPAGRIVREDEVGLTAARLRAIAESKGDVLVWVDDDNILAENYLERADEFHRAWPMLGIWGCGDYRPEWEEAPAPALQPFLAYLAVHRIPRDRWSNQAFDYGAMPAGAGLCSRRLVAERYAQNVRTDPRRRLLGRVGAQLSACEDFDFGLTALDVGLGMGVFLAFSLTHLMPKGRVQKEYLRRLAEGHAYSTVMLMAMRQPDYAPPRRGGLARLRRWRYLRALGPVERELEADKLRGERRAEQTLATGTSAR